MIRQLMRFNYKAILRISARLSRIRFFFRRWQFESSGKGCRMAGHVRVSPHLEVILGDNVVLRRRVTLSGRGKLVIGDNTTLNEGVIIAAYESVTIGNDCLFAPRAYVLDVDHRFDRSGVPASRQGYVTSEVRIADGSWIGANAVITRGVQLGESCIVGANSVVTRSFRSGSVIGGVPARSIRDRSD